MDELVEKLPPVKKKVKKVELSFQAKKWKNYFIKTAITPEAFLERYPDHINKDIIEELITYNKNKKDGI